MKKSKYELECLVYILLNGKELQHQNFYYDGICFSTVAEAREFMKNRGYSNYEYSVVYEYIVSSINGDCIYGSGLGFSKEEAKQSLNKSISYYCMELTKYGKIKDNN